MKSIFSLVFSIVALSTSALAQSKKPMPTASAVTVIQPEFFANPSKFDNKLITIPNAVLRPRIEVTANCKAVEFGEKPITVEFNKAEFNNKVCFSMDQVDKKKLAESTTGPTKASITIKGTAKDGFTIISFVPNP